MTFIKKFYDADIADTGAAEVVAEPVNVAAAMAKFGKKSDENSMASQEPTDIPKVEIKEKQPEAAAIVAKEETAKPQSEPSQEKQVEEPKKEATAPIVQEQPKVQTLDEVLKNNQPDTILKALGFDDEKVALVSQLKDIDPKVVGILQAYKNGTLEGYLKEASTDYQKMSAEELMRHQLRREYPKASEKALEALYESEVIERYKLDPDIYTTTEVEKGRLLLEAKADKYRDEFTANQEKYLLPKPPEPKKEAIPDNSADLQRQQIEAYRKELSETSFAKDIFANKKITFGEGDEKFSYPVDPNSLIDILTDGTKWAETMYEKQGDEYVLKAEHQMLVAAFAQDSKKFLSEYAKHLKSIGAKEVIDPIDNASVPNTAIPSQPEKPITSLAEAMARKGRRNNGGN